MGEPRDIIVIGGSAGAVEAVTMLVSRLLAQLDADREAIECDRIYVAPPDRHMLLEPGRITLSSGPKESGHRPAIDPLLRSAAGAYGERVIAVILSGTLDDGSTGLRLVRRHGGSAMVQDPVEALFSRMPLNAIDWAKPQHVAPVAGSRD